MLDSIDKFCQDAGTRGAPVVPERHPEKDENDEEEIEDVSENEGRGSAPGRSTP